MAHCLQSNVVSSFISSTSIKIYPSTKKGLCCFPIIALPSVHFRLLSHKGNNYPIRVLSFKNSITTELPSNTPPNENRTDAESNAGPLIQSENSPQNFNHEIGGKVNSEVESSTLVGETIQTNDSSDTLEKDDVSNIQGSEKNDEGEGTEEEEDEELELEKGYKMKRVCDRLVDVFYVEKTTPAEWRKLLGFSKEWNTIRPHFYKRCRARAKEMEDPSKRADLYKLARKLKEVDDDMMRHDELLECIENSTDLDALVFKRRKDFTGDFFEHIKLLCTVNSQSPQRREELIALAARCMTAINSHDNFIENEALLGPAQTKFDEILNSPTLGDACAKIDDLAKKRELDPALMLLFTKAYSAAKESTMMKDEAKDIMYHLYMQMRASMQRLIPKDVRIMKHLISLEDPREQFTALTAAFSPGDEYEGKNEDMLYTTPKRLYKWVNHVLNAYYSNKENTLIKEAQNLMNPEVIMRIEVLKDILEDQFL